MNGTHSYSNSKYANFINQIKTTDGFSQNNYKSFFCCLESSEKNFNNSKFLKKIYNLNNNTKIIFIKIKLYKIYGILKFYFLQRYLLKKEFTKILNQIKPDLVYTRSYLLSELSIQKKIPVIIESHASPFKNNFDIKSFFKKYSKNQFIKKLVTIHPILKKGFIKRGFPKNKIEVILDAADNKIFKLKKKKNKTFTIFYMGSFYEYKGVFTILKAAKLLKDIKFMMVGGSGKEFLNVKKFIQNNKIKNVKILPWVTMNKLPNLISKAKLLLLVPEKSDPSSNWTSPVKLNEYLSTGIPLICSDIPSLTYALPKSIVTFSKAGDVKNLAETIRKIKINYTSFVKKAKKGIDYSKKNSYKIRSQKILK